LGRVCRTRIPAGWAFKYNLRFAGQYFDEETGLHYNYFRDYDPKTGRYVQSDPIGLAGGLNTYLYANANPLSYIDPLGLMGQGSGRGAYPPGTGPGAPLGHVGGAIGAVGDFGSSFKDMLDATYLEGSAHKGWANQDKYFHCRANCEAAQRGAGGVCTATELSDFREWFDQVIKGDPAASSVADQIANSFGRASGKANVNGDCRQLCSIYRPGGSFPAHF
jgi:RHS repeat-associated protein